MKYFALALRDAMNRVCTIGICPPMPNAPCPMPHAQCPMPNTSVYARRTAA
ncbi:hypothetical protein [Calothrix sp. FACHB-168]|uniref:hypothetical protein n=1 Tax=Calothrix sp. FACHB-168 TaxID=2692780 RepID=UPI001686C985|nr:hypothetical protein [Calothrix sp. FACHB-168]MBD2202230.1 hypothetical protein [Calothrix sp. FACHB-168]